MNRMTTEDKRAHQLTFAIEMLACFGDVLICNSLVQNIKRLYPDSKVLFIVDKPWADVARYQKGADEVCVFDKRGKNSGLFGMLWYVLTFRYKVDYLLVFHPNTRSRILARLLPAKRKYQWIADWDIKMQENMANILKQITDEEIINYPITYCYDGSLDDKYKDIFADNKKCIALSTTTKRPEKDMPIETAVELVNKLNKENYKVLYVGAGKLAGEYAQQLKDNNCDFVNLVDRTKITDLACVLKSCTALISVDTGTMHFGYSLNVPTVCIFYTQDTVSLWAPSKEMYNVEVITEDYSVQNIFEKLQVLTEK